MGKFYDEIPQSHVQWIMKQRMFWVATAPLGAQGHVNVSPKGTADCFHVVNSTQVWYEDLTGSGIETVSHIRENGRITIMFCAFEGPPRILRLFGIGTVHEYGSPGYNKLIPAASRTPGSRAAIVIDVHQVGTSCGYSVPLYDFVMQRTQLNRLADILEDVERAEAASPDRQHPDRDRDATENVSDNNKTLTQMSIRSYWLLENVKSLDGLPALLAAPDNMLNLTPMKNFDKSCPRPMLRDLRRKTEVANTTARDVRLFASGFVLGVVALFGFTKLV